jgi:hypothetical protein
MFQLYNLNDGTFPLTSCGEKSVKSFISDDNLHS